MSSFYREINLWYKICISTIVLSYSLITYVMKKFLVISVLLAMFGSCLALRAQNTQEEYLGLPGDNLNLYAVMKLFQESETLEGFERNLNDQNSQINNLDLNGDNYVDYIKVLDYVDGNVHTIVLQVAINNRENQDVAVFTVQRFSNNQVQIQLIGDETLYGKNYIIEPIFDNGNQGETPNPGYLGNNGNINGQNVIVARTTTYEIANWPLVRYIYMPTYVVWRSGWYWNYYPSYWHPWRPYYWHYYYGYHSRWYGHYYSHYRRWNNYRYARWNDFYYNGKRSYSPVVNINIRTGHYKTTYSRPSQRRNGEALYAKMHPAQNNRSANRTAGNNTTRRSASQATPARQSTVSNSATRRTNNAVTNKTVTNTRTKESTVSTRRSPADVSNKQAARTQTVQRTASTQAERRPATTVTNRSVTKTQPVQRAASTQPARRPATTVSSRSVPKSQPVQRAASTQPARRPATTVSSRSVPKSQPVQRAASPSTRKSSTAVNSANRRSSASSKPAASSRNETKKKAVEPAKSTRRK